MFGEWDGFVVYEVGDAATAAMFSGVASASGLIERVKTQQLLRMDEVHTALDLAKLLDPAYVPPGGSGSGAPTTKATASCRRPHTVREPDRRRRRCSPINRNRRSAPVSITRVTRSSLLSDLILPMPDEH